MPRRSKQEHASLDAELSNLREAHRSQQRALEDAATERTSLLRRIEELQQRVNRLAAERETSEKKYLKQVHSSSSTTCCLSSNSLTSRSRTLRSCFRLRCSRDRSRS